MVKYDNFDPFWILDKPFVQTVIGRFWPQKPNPFEAMWFHVDVEDSDKLLVAVHVHTDSPHEKQKWVIMFHGLTGCSESRYNVRLTYKLYSLGYNVMRVNFRNAGSSMGLSTQLHHAARSDDIAASIQWLGKAINAQVTLSNIAPKDRAKVVEQKIQELQQDQLAHSKNKLTDSLFDSNNQCSTQAYTAYPDIELNLVGFSLGGTTMLHYVSELNERGLAGKLPLNKILTLCSPLNLFHTSDHIVKPENVFFNNYFRHELIKDIKAWNKITHQLDEKISTGEVDFNSVVTVFDFDDMVLAPLVGFKDATTYYSNASVCNRFDKIKNECLLLHAIDDPIVDNSAFYDLDHDYLNICLTQKGGHLGYIARPGSPLRYMDHWIIKNITGHDE